MKILVSIFLIATGMIPAVAQKTDPVKIGYLIQDQTYLSARQGAELAVKTANEKGGLNGRPFQIIVKSMEGPWGTGSTKAVDLIFNHNAWALCGTHDGRNAHLVEQAATKTTTVFVSAWSSDPTLSQAFVPWFFNLVPTDLAQADMILTEIYDRKKFTRIAVVTDNSYEAKQSLKAFLRIQAESKREKPVLFDYENFKNKPENLVNEIKNSGTACILLYTTPQNSYGIVKALKIQHLAVPVYASLAVLNENVLTPSQLQEMNDVILVPSGLWSSEKKQVFTQTYFKTYGKMPGISAAYAYDAMNVLIEAIKNCKSEEREDIQQAIAGLRFNGITGLIAFDEYGNRKFTGMVCRILNGLPVGNVK